jgi:hypothetical protein
VFHLLLQTAISALQSVLQEDFKATEIEVVYVCLSKLKLHNTNCTVVFDDFFNNNMLS